MTVLDWLPSVAWAVFVGWSVSRPGSGRPATVPAEPAPLPVESHGRHRWEDRAAAPAIPAGTKEAPTPITEPITAPAQPGNGGRP